MKKLVILLMMAGLIFSQVDVASAQIKNPLKKKVEKNVDKGLDNLEEGIGNLFKKDKNAESDKEGKQADQEQAQEQVQATDAKQTGAPAGSGKQAAVVELKWSKYDFVPGDKIIFEDNLIFEENGEFPSRWDLVNGTVENAEFGGEMIIMFRGGSPTIVPYLKNPNIDYLPEVFTVEFDLYLPSNTFSVYFYDRKNQQVPRGVNNLSIGVNNMTMGQASSTLPGGKNIAKRWAHISIAHTSGKFKAYIDDTRLINIPHLEFNPTGISLHSYHANDNNRTYIKNIRLAEGGVKYYDRFLQDGKIVSNGIRFDVGKATLRQESMGVLNEIYKMFSDHPEISVCIEGHTDSDGDTDLNQKLSEERAEAVRKQLVSMGIKAERLTSKGFGESKPVNTNDTPENRRVEFVKVTGSASSNTSSNASGNTSSVSTGNSIQNTKTYKAVKIGSQEWMAENLDVSVFRNGDIIPEAKAVDEWENAKWEKKPVWCYYDSDASNKGNGKLYNWFAVNDPRGLAPEGWKIPADEDLDKIRNYLGISNAGKKLKSTDGWKDGGNGSGETGFNGIATGFRDYDGSFQKSGAEAFWWSSTSTDTGDPSDNDSPWASCRYLSYEDNYLHKHNVSKGAGLSVRCIRD